MKRARDGPSTSSQLQRYLGDAQWRLLDRLGLSVTITDHTPLGLRLDELARSGSLDELERPELMRELMRLPILVRANAHARELLRLAVELPAPLYRVLEPDPVVFARIARAIAAREPRVVDEIEATLPDGERRWFAFESRLVYEADVVWGLTSATDITARRDLAEELTEANRFLDSIIENIPNMIFVKDAEQLRFVRFNRAGEELLGYKREELVGKSDHDFFPESEADSFTGHDRRVLAAGEILVIPEEPIHTRYLGKRWLRTRKIPIRDASGEPRYLLGISEDITEVKALHDQAGRMKRVFEQAAIPMVLCDPAGRLDQPNQAFFALYGAACTCDGRALADLAAPRERVAVDAEHARLTQTEHVAYETHHLRADGSEFPVLVDVVRMRRADGEVAHLFATVHDLTELERTRSVLERRTRQLEIANQHKDQFLATMSHELRTPLNAVIGFSELLKDGLAGPLTAQQREYVCDIYESGEHLLELINDVLDLSKIEAGKMDLESEPCRLARLLGECLAVFRGRAEQYGIQLELTIVSDPGEVMLDRRKIKQILLNLLSNAVKFTPRGGAIGLSCKEVDRDGCPAIEVAVSDTGVGVEPDKIPLLFQPFFQADSSLTRRYQGSGLGLAMVERLAELHGGSVSVASELGKGSRFAVLLPKVSANRRERPLEATRAR